MHLNVFKCFLKCFCAISLGVAAPRALEKDTEAVQPGPDDSLGSEHWEGAWAIEVPDTESESEQRGNTS